MHIWQYLIIKVVFFSSGAFRKPSLESENHESRRTKCKRFQISYSKIQTKFKHAIYVYETSLQELR